MLEMVIVLDEFPVQDLLSARLSGLGVLLFVGRIRGLSYART